MFWRRGCDRSIHGTAAIDAASVTVATLLYLEQFYEGTPWFSSCRTVLPVCTARFRQIVLPTTRPGVSATTSASRHVLRRRIACAKSIAPSPRRATIDCRSMNSLAWMDQ